METVTMDQELLSLEQRSDFQNDPTVGSMIDVLEDLPVRENATSLIFSDDNGSKQEKLKALTPKSLTEEALLSSPEAKTKEFSLENVGVDLKKQQSYGVTLNRDIRQEQLTQLAAARIREGESMVELSTRNAWEKESETLNWTVHAKSRGLIYWIRNEIKSSSSFEVTKDRLAELRKKKQVSSDSNDAATIEQTLGVCSINYERTTFIEPTDYLLLRLERQSRDGCFKIAEMSIEDKRCPALPGFKRGQLELRYWHLVPDETNANCSKLWIIETIKLKSKGNEAEIKLAHEKNQNLIKKVLAELQF